MKQRFVCLKCKGHFKKLTKEGLCAGCHLDKYGKWSKEFQEEKKNEHP